MKVTVTVFSSEGVAGFAGVFGVVGVSGSLVVVGVAGVSAGKTGVRTGSAPGLQLVIEKRDKRMPDKKAI